MDQTPPASPEAPHNPVLQPRHSSPSLSGPLALHIVDHPPPEFHNQQFGSRHCFAVVVELVCSSTGARITDFGGATWLVAAKLCYADDGRQPVASQQILTSISAQRMGDDSPTAKLEFRIEDVSRNHQNRSFALALVAYQDTDEATRSTEVFTNPIKVLSKKPKSERDLAKKLSDDKRKAELIDTLKSRELGRDTHSRARGQRVAKVKAELKITMTASCEAAREILPMHLDTVDHVLPSACEGTDAGRGGGGGGPVLQPASTMLATVLGFGEDGSSTLTSGRASAAPTSTPRKPPAPRTHAHATPHSPTPTRHIAAATPAGAAAAARRAPASAPRRAATSATAAALAKVSAGSKRARQVGGMPDAASDHDHLPEDDARAPTRPRVSGSPMVAGGRGARHLSDACSMALPDVLSKALGEGSSGLGTGCADRLFHNIHGIGCRSPSLMSHMPGGSEGRVIGAGAARAGDDDLDSDLDSDSVVFGLMRHGQVSTGGQVREAGGEEEEGGDDRDKDVDEGDADFFGFGEGADMELGADGLLGPYYRHRQQQGAPATLSKGHGQPVAGFVAERSKALAAGVAAPSAAHVAALCGRHSSQSHTRPFPPSPTPASFHAGMLPPVPSLSIDGRMTSADVRAAALGGHMVQASVGKQLDMGEEFARALWDSTNTMNLVSLDAVHSPDSVGGSHARTRAHAPNLRVVATSSTRPPRTSLHGRSTSSGSASTLLPRPEHAAVCTTSTIMIAHTTRCPHPLTPLLELGLGASQHAAAASQNAGGLASTTAGSIDFAHGPLALDELLTRLSAAGRDLQLGRAHLAGMLTPGASLSPRIGTPILSIAPAAGSSTSSSLWTVAHSPRSGGGCEHGGGRLQDRLPPFPPLSRNASNCSVGSLGEVVL